MKKIGITVFSIVLCLVSANRLNAQDFHLSQYDASPLYVNPAMTGMFNGKYRIHGHYRNQWSSVASPFVTSSISFDTPMNNFGVGGIIISDNSNSDGVSIYNVLNLLTSFSYNFTLDSNQFHHLGFGTQLGAIHKSININKLTFHNQYTNTNTGGFDPGLPSGEQLETNSIFMPEVALSFIYFYSNNSARINPYCGLSVFHLTEPQETFYANENRLPKRWIFHTGTNINITPLLQLTPKLLIMNQGNANEKTITLNVNYYLKREDTWLFGGPTYRFFNFNEISKKESIVILLGLKKGALTYRVSYDINISSLSGISKGRGGFELSLTYVINRITFPPAGCPRI